MFRSIRKRFTYANVAATLALVFAMTGGAYAASKFLITSTKQIKPSVLAQLKGKAGAKGETGPAGPGGPAGPAGPTGPTGSKGENGAGGKDGTNGTNGKSVTVNNTAAGCSEGGITAEVEGSGVKHEVCNGIAGAPGTPGMIHPGETLPSKASETGTWAITVTTVGVPEYSPLSFTVKLAAAIPKGHIFYIGKEEGFKEAKEQAEFTTHCHEGTAANPEAMPGFLCVYLGKELLPSKTNVVVVGVVSPLTSSPGTSVTGGAMEAVATEVEGFPAELLGTWAVTAE